MCAFEYLARTEGIIPAIESAHAVAYAMKLAPPWGTRSSSSPSRAGATRTVPPSPDTEGGSP